MKEITLKLTDKQYAMIIHDTVMRTGNWTQEEAVKQIMLALERANPSSSGYGQFKDRIASHEEGIRRVQYMQCVFVNEGLSDFINEIPCGDGEAATFCQKCSSALLPGEIGFCVNCRRG